MLLRLAQLALWLAVAAVGILLVLAVLYFAHGSLEEFPTADDHSKVRLVSGVGAALLLAVGLALLALLRRVSQAARGRRPADSADPPAA